MRIIFLLLISLSLYATQRIITLAPSISEIVFALGRGNEIVGVSEYASYPAGVKKITKIGGYTNPSLEKIFSLNPTLVIGQAHYNKTLRQLNQLGIKTLSLEMTNIANIKASITKIASAIDADANILIDSIDKAIADAQEKAKTSYSNRQVEFQEKPTSKKRVLIVYGLSLDINRGLYIAGHNIFYEDIIHMCGAENAYKSQQLSQPVLHYESLVALNPDSVILLHHSATDGDIDFNKAKELWYNIPINAGINKKVTILSKDYLSIPSHRVAQSITDLCEVISQ